MGTWRDVLAGRALRSHLCSKMLLSRFSAPEKYVFGETLVVVQRIRVASIVESFGPRVTSTGCGYSSGDWIQDRPAVLSKEDRASKHGFVNLLDTRRG